MIATDAQFANNFWGEKHTGYHVLYENLRKGEENIHEITQFLKDRSTFEEETQKILNKNATKIGSFISHGSTFTSGWAVTKGTLELLAEIHSAFLNNIQELIREVTKYQEDFAKTKKRAKEQEVIDAVNLMQTTTTCLQKSKETYFTRLNELERLKRDSSANPKEITKSESKLLKSKEEYRQYVEKYEKVRINFEEKMERSFALFQAHNLDHYGALKQLLFSFAVNQQESMSAAVQVCSQFREAVQALEASQFVEKFVKDFGTGKDRPLPAVFEDVDGLLDEPNDQRSHTTSNSHSLPSSCNSSAKIGTDAPKPPATAHDLLTMDISENWLNAQKNSQASPTASESSLPDATLSSALPPTVPPPSFSASLGGGTKKLSMWLPKRKKNSSQSSLPDADENNSSGGFLKFRKGSKTKKSVTDLSAGEKERPEDAHSTASSSRSDEKVLNGAALNGGSNSPATVTVAVDEEGFTIRREEEGVEKEETHWSSCSSSEDEDENDMQKSKIRALTIRPVEKADVNASVDELRDAIGSITINRSNTFDKDPWSCSSSRAPFSQSLGGGGIKPLRAAFTGDEHLRRKISESEFSRSNVPLSFSASLSAAPSLGLARARPRSNTPTHWSSSTLTQPMGTHSAHPPLIKKDSSGSQEWGSSSVPMGHSESVNSLDGSFSNIANLSASTMNLMQATISEQRIPLAMAVNEYSHVWFKGVDITSRSVRTFGTVMISFASSSLPLLTDVKSDVELLQFRLIDAENVKAVLPNKQLLLPDSVAVQSGPIYRYTFDRLALANWLLAQQKEKATSAFYNAEVLRYELTDESCGEPPLILTSYWKTEKEHTDLRIDYRLNSECPLQSPLLNLSFSTKVNGGVMSVTSDPTAQWDEASGSLSWTISELSRHGQVSGSLKARLFVKEGPSTPAHTYVTFQSNDSTISGASVSLDSGDVFHLSMVRRKVIAGKYFCESELRK